MMVWRPVSRRSLPRRRAAATRTCTAATRSGFAGFAFVVLVSALVSAFVFASTSLACTSRWAPAFPCSVRALPASLPVAALALCLALGVALAGVVVVASTSRRARTQIVRFSSRGSRGISTCLLAQPLSRAPFNVILDRPVFASRQDTVALRLAKVRLRNRRRNNVAKLHNVTCAIHHSAHSDLHLARFACSVFYSDESNAASQRAVDARARAEGNRIEPFDRQRCSAFGCVCYSINVRVLALRQTVRSASCKVESLRRRWQARSGEIRWH